MEREPREDGAIVYSARARWTPAIAAVAGAIGGAAAGIATRLGGVGVVAGLAALALAWAFAPRVVLRVDPKARRIVRSYVGRVLLDVPFDAVQNVAARKLDVAQPGMTDRRGRRYTAAVLEIGTNDEDITIVDLETEKQAIEDAKQLARAFGIDEAPAEAPLLWLAIRKSRSP